MEILKKIKEDLNDNYFDNMIYTFDSSERKEYRELQKILNKDYGFLDIVLDFRDYYRLANLLRRETDDDEDKPITREEIDADEVRNAILNDYLYYTLLIKAGVDVSTNQTKLNKLFNGLYNMEESLLPFLCLDSIFEQSFRRGKKGVRVHILFDEIADFNLQLHVNDMFSTQSDVAFIGYCTDKPLTYYTYSGQPLEPGVDYKPVVSDKKRKSHIKKIEGRN